MFKIHSNNDKDYFIIAPQGSMSSNRSHYLESVLLKKTIVEYYKWIAEFPSSKLIVYPSFISYHLSKTDANKVIKILNKEYKKLVQKSSQT